MVESTITRYSTQLLERRWLSKKAFEMRLKKPPAFEFMPGQRICLGYKAVERDYSLVCAPDDPDLVLCIRYVKDGMLSTELETAQIGAQFQFTGPDGYFVFRPSDRPAIFVATGTGIAPFCSMLRSGVTEFTLLHGVETTEDLYYTSEFKT